MGFDLDPDRVHLNHGAYGAVPRVVREGVVRRAAEVERNPHRYHRVELTGRIREARARAASFLHLGGDDIVLVRNVSEATATVPGSLDLRAGDEVVVTDQNHRGVRFAVDAVAGVAAPGWWSWPCRSTPTSSTSWPRSRRRSERAPGS